MKLNDTETYSLIEQYEALLRKYHSRVNRLCTIEDFKSEVFLRIRGRVLRNPKLHFNYLSMVANQLSGLIYKNSCKAMKFNKNMSFEEIENQLGTINSDLQKRNLSEFKNRYSYYNDIGLIDDMTNKFNSDEFEIVKLISEGYNKTEIARKLNTSMAKLSQKIETIIKPRIANYISDQDISLTGLTEYADNTD